jgi:elongation factor Ts
MTTVTAGMVKDLREKTGAGMMDCKTALDETKGDIEAAIDLLRKKGLSKAAKKAGRIAADGLVGLIVSGKSGAVVEVNSETDFVARNEEFQDMVTNIATAALHTHGDTAKLLAAAYPGSKSNVETFVKDAVAKIGENMSVRRTAAVSVTDGVVASYVHNKVDPAKPALGKIGVLVALESAGKNSDELAATGRMIAMHIANTNPISLDVSGVPTETIERETAIIKDKNKDKKPELMDKIVAGGLKAFAKENCLLEQAFIMDTSKTITQVLKEAEAKAGGAVAIKSYIRYALGEGIEKKEEDFAAEVAKTMSDAAAASKK